MLSQWLRRISDIRTDRARLVDQPQETDPRGSRDRYRHLPNWYVNIPH